jgi:hypothetical protein
MKRLIHRLMALISTLAVIAASACGPLPRLDAVPESKQGDVTVLGIKDVRYWGDEVTPQMIADGVAAFRREQAAAIAAGHPGPLPPAYYLAISGGGENGAFGAGLLVGWTAAGTRPTFKLVTGISTGALTAPFAFLGPAYDPELKQIYTQIRPENVLAKRWILSGVLSDALATNEPLYRTIQRYVTPALLQGIAQQYQKGRLLLIATTDLDAGRPVIWNIGKIAASGKPGTVELIQKILRAPRPAMGRREPTDAKHCGALHIVADPDAGSGRLVPDLQRLPTRRRGLQSRQYAGDLQRAAPILL